MQVITTENTRSRCEGKVEPSETNTPAVYWLNGGVARRPAPRLCAPGQPSPAHSCEICWATSHVLYPNTLPQQQTPKARSRSRSRSRSRVGCITLGRNSGSAPLLSANNLFPGMVAQGHFLQSITLPMVWAKGDGCEVDCVP